MIVSAVDASLLGCGFIGLNEGLTAISTFCACAIAARENELLDVYALWILNNTSIAVMTHVCDVLFFGCVIGG